MTKDHFIILLSFICTLTMPSCRLNNKDKQPDRITLPDTTDSKPVKDSALGKKEIKNQFADTTIFPFSDSTYRLSIHMFGPGENFDEEDMNATITFSRVTKNRTVTYFKDPTHCMSLIFGLADMNNDHVNDVLVFNATGARANLTYHLYLTDTVKHRLIYVKNFEDLPNPGLNSPYNIISSLGLAGTNYYKFYTISRKNKLINLGHGFYDDGTDSTKYDRTINSIVKDRQKK